MTDIRDGDDGSCCSSSASTVKISNFTVPRDSPVLGLLFGWLSGTNVMYQLHKLKRLSKTTDFLLELEPFVRHATSIGLPSHFDEMACAVVVSKFFQEHEMDYIEEFLKHRKAFDSNDRKIDLVEHVKHRTADDDDQKRPAEYVKHLMADDEGNPRVKRSRGNDEHVAAAPGVRSVAAAASVNDGTDALANDSAPATGSAPGVAEVVVKQGDAANAPFHDASSPSVSVKTPSTHSRTLDSAAVPIELGGATGSPSDDSSNLGGTATGVDAEQVVEHGRAMSVDAEQVVKHGGAAGSTSEDSSMLRGSDMSVDAQDGMLP